MKENRLTVKIVETQPRFENWAIEDLPTVIDPETIRVTVFTPSDIRDMAEIYQKAFNSQNQRLYREIDGARLIWDEEPWTEESAKTQLEEELTAPGVICLVAKARSPENEVVIGFIICRPVDFATLSQICGSEETAAAIISASSNVSPLLLWEDAATLNLRTPKGETIRGVGGKLYRTMAETADLLDVVSIGRTSPGSFAEKILPKIGFATTNPLIQDGKDKQRYWLIRKTSKYEKE